MAVLSDSGTRSGRSPLPKRMAITPASTCPFLDLPTELRLLIYNFVRLDGQLMTVGTALLDGSQPDVFHRLYGGGRTPLPGIPKNHEPIVESNYDASLLSATGPKTIRLESCPRSAHRPDEFSKETGECALLLVSRKVHEEVKQQLQRSRGDKTTSVFIQYPDGLHVCSTLAVRLLRQARSVHLAGAYQPTSFQPQRAANLPPAYSHHQSGPERGLHGDVKPKSSEQLAELVIGFFGSRVIRRPLAKFEMRVYYPGDDSYSTVWGDDSSPIVVALRNILSGEVAIEVWRGRYGTGVYLAAKQVEGSKRSVSTVWRKLEEGRTGEPVCGSWVVDPAWPSWQEDYKMSTGPKGDLIVSTPEA